MIIDIHGHYTTEPPQLAAFRDKQLAGLADSARRPSSTDLGISDEQLLKSVEPQLKMQKERGATSRSSRPGLRHGPPRRDGSGRRAVGARLQ